MKSADLRSSFLRGKRHHRQRTRTDRNPAGRWFHPRFEPLECRLVLSAVVGSFLFYDESSFDGGVAGVSPLDDNAIATDKSPYLPNGSMASFGNMSSYSRGINGIMIDVDGPGLHASITASDFIFRVGDNNDPSTWSTAPTPTGMTVRLGAGVGGSDRVVITWASGAIKDTNLEVQMLPTPNTGLSSTYDSFWTSKVGKVTDPGAATVFSVLAAADGGAVLANTGLFVGITNLYDVDRSNFVIAAADRGIVLTNTGFISRLNLQLSPALNAALSNDTGPGGVPNSDGITQDPAIDGTLISGATITAFVAGLNAGPLSTDILPLVQPDDTFAISEALLETMNGGPLSDGAYVLHLRADDSLGKISHIDVPFTLKRSIVVPGLPDLNSASDSGASSVDDITNVNTPTIEVTAEAGSTVTLYVDGAPVQSQAANPLAVFTLSTLSDGVKSVTATAEDGAGNVSGISSALAMTIHTVAPTVTASTLLPFGDDVTPHVTIAATSGLGLANGTQVRLDADVNNDGDFLDANESNRTQSTLFNGGSYFELTPALPATDPIAGPYLVQLRARVTDIAGNEGVSPLSSLSIDTLGSTALADYVNAADSTYFVGATPASTIAGPGYTVYVFDLKSQTWRLGDVDKPLWEHWLQIIVPDTVSQSTALMLIGGGSTSASAPNSLSDEMFVMGSIAVAREMVTVILPTVPNQPLEFIDEVNNPRSEDAIIAYTFDKYVNNIGAPGNDTWPLLLPMVKSAVKAMDAVQARDTTLPGGVDIVDFIVSGYSKRGWTTWLTGAVDSRVKSIIPGVIDLLNMDESMVNHYGFYGFFAPAIADYQDFNLIQNIAMPENTDLGRIVDPYSYLFNSNLTTMPKFLIMSSGDEFFVPDSGQFYLNDLPGPSYVRYIPNTGHGLIMPGDSLPFDAINSSNSWTDAILFNRTLPDYSWTVDQDGGIRMTSVTAPTTVKLWQGTNPATRDFRNADTSVTWTSSVLADQGGGVYVGNVPVPATGATGYFVEMTYPSAIGGNPYIFTTEIRVASNIPRTPWPFFVPNNDSEDGDGGGGGIASAAVASGGQNDLVFGLSSTAAPTAKAAVASPAVASAPAIAPPAQLARDEATSALFDDWSWNDGDLGTLAESSDTDAVDSVLASLESGLLE